MTKTGSNDLCPCGSGLKYKKCCHVKVDTVAGLRREEHAAVETALNWMHEHYWLDSLLENKSLDVSFLWQRLGLER